MAQQYFCDSCGDPHPAILATLLYILTAHHHADVGLPPEDSVRLLESEEWPDGYAEPTNWN